MKPHRYATATVAALLTLAACAENPLGPERTANNVAEASARGGGNAYTFTQLDVRDGAGNVISFNTFASGINAGGEIVGWYSTGAGCSTGTAPCATKGFKLIDGVYTPVVYHDAVTGADAVLTQLRGVAPNGDVVGSYRNAGEPSVNAHGFILTTAGAFIREDHPYHTNTIAQRILPDGTVLGCYHGIDQMATMHGMTNRGGAITEIETAASMTNGGTPGGGERTGFFIDMENQVTRGFLQEGGVFTAFDAPNSVATQAWDMSPGGTIVGLFVDDGANNATHGFVLDHGRYTTINFSATSTYTDVFGTNASGDIVGKFKVPGDPAFHGYVATQRGV